MSDPANSASDFDFEVGDWCVSHRRLRDRLCDCTDWETFEGTSSMRKVLGGDGNVEDNLLHFPTGDYRAIAIRSFDRTSENWAIWWLSTADPHKLDVPVIGRFTDGTGTFVAKDILRGAPVLVRFVWLRTDTDRPRWEQAMSDDDGATWETNWTMDFRRS